MTALRIGLIGSGAIGGTVIASLLDDPHVRVEGVLRRRESAADATLRVVHRVADFDSGITLVVEAAGAEALADHGIAVLASGRDLAILSTSACVDDALLRGLRQAAADSGRRLVALSGAIGGLDALSAARAAGLTAVRYVGRKPPRAWKSTLAAEHVDLDRLAVATPIFEGTAREAVLRYPQNANVAATIALVGLGFDRTTVTLIADPGIDRNIHVLEAEGAAGRIRFESEGYAMASNPKTSVMTAFSIVSFLRTGAGSLAL
jgi:aspartate dehydrogenase